MEKMSMSEATARFTFTAACGLSILAAGAAIVLRLRGVQGPAVIFLMMAFLACLVTLMSFRRYKMLRGVRWKQEIKTAEDEMGQVLNHARMNMIIEHVTGPLNTGMASENPKRSTTEE
jgi:hypothetical protein